MSSKQRRAAFLKSSVNAATSAAAALACASRLASRCSSFADSATSMHSSLRCYRPVSRVDAIAASKAPQSSRLRNAPLGLVDVAVAVRIQL